MLSNNIINNSSWIKKLTWLNIIIQFSFPLACSLTPAIASAQRHSPLLTKPADVSAMATHPYVLQKSETVTSVAEKYNISTETLRKLNQFRTFARGFDHLQPGDELEVPLAPLPAVTWQDAPVLAASDSAEKKVASLAARTGTFLANNPNSEAAASLARGMATGKANAEVQQWLGRFGTARVQLDADKNLSLKNSQLDLLLPLHDQPDRLIFTQGSLHRTDERAQANLGVGLRHFAEDFMVGANAFLDYDLSRDHLRSGVGLEYWRDFIRLGINGYRGLSNWKTSRDFTDYRERPANGWDIRSEGWLPTMPHLGARLHYEKYYGNEVALFGKDYRQKNPHAVTAGVTFTPFPLLTLSADHRQGRQDQSDRSIGAQINYQPGVPWHKQTDSREVATLRSLAGGRYDLVDRNNNIVLKYRKDEVIKLKTASLVKGYAGEQKSLSVAVNSKYALARIDWSAAELIASGGKIIANGPADFSVVLPAYQYGAAGINNYTIGAIAIDEKGNASRRAETQVTVTEAAISLANSTLTPAKSVLPADGQSQQTLTLTVKDSQGMPVDIQEDEIAVQEKAQIENSGAVLSAFKRQSAGYYTAVLRAGVRPQALTVTPAAREAVFSSAAVSLIANEATARVASLTVVKDGAAANGQAQNQLLAVVTDAEGNPVPAHKITITADNGASVVATAMTNEQGEATLNVTSLQAGQSTVSARVGDSEAKSVKLSFIADTATAAVSKFEIVQDGAAANGKAENRVKVTVKDANGNLVPSQNVMLAADNEALLPASVTTDEQGEAVVTVTSLKAGQSTVTARVRDDVVKSLTLSFIADMTTVTVKDLQILADAATANGQAENRIKVSVADANGNPISQQRVTFAADNGAKIVQTATTDEQGEAVVVVTSLRAGKSNVSARVGESEAKSVQISFIADTATAAISKFEVIYDGAAANGQAENRVKVTVTDANDNPVAAQNVALAADNEASIPASVTTDEQGEAVVAVTSLKAGKSTITARTGDETAKSVNLNFVADIATVAIKDMAILADGAAANGQAENQIKVVVTDVNGNPLPEQLITLVADNGANIVQNVTTDEKGEATAVVTSLKAGVSKVTAQLGSQTQSVSVTFIADKATAAIDTLEVVNDSALANGSAENRVKVTVRDAHGNLLTGQTVSFAADNGANIVQTAITDDKGEATVAVTSLKAGESIVTARTGESTAKSVSVTFIADTATATLSSIELVDNGAVANGTAENRVKVMVTDANGNPLSAYSVSLVADNGASVTSPVTTDENGEAVAVVTSIKAGTSQVTASIGNGATKNINVSFIGDASTATLAGLEVIADSAPADGIAANTLKVTVRDAHDNPLAGHSVTLVADSGVQLSASSVTTGADGTATFTATSKKEGSYNVTASTNGHSATVTTNFVEVEIVAANSTFTLNKNIVTSDGTDAITLSFTARDKNNNPVSGKEITFEVTGLDGAQVGNVSESEGVYTASLTSPNTGIGQVKVRVNGKELEGLTALDIGAYRAEINLTL